MHILKSLLLRTLLAAGTFAAAGCACANPLYHVTVDTRTLPGTGGYVDFLFAGPSSPTSPAAPTATIARVTGAFDDADNFAWGSPRGTLASSLVLGNGDEYGAWLRFGGILAFDVAFGGIEAPGASGMDLSVALLGADRFSYAPGTSGNVVTFSLQPGEADDVTTDAALAGVTPLPEPAALAQMATGFLLLAGALRRRRR
jgi:hypothetical protein